MTQHRKRFTEGMLDTDIILTELDVRSGQTVVDAGCGTGYMSILFAKETGPTGQVYALDINQAYITELRAQYREPNFRAQVCDMSDALPLDAASVDTIYVSTVIHSRTREQLQAFVAEAQRTLKPGGTLAVVELAKHDTPFGPPLKQRYSPEELQAAIGFSPVKTVPVAEHFYMQLFRNQPM